MRIKVSAVDKAFLDLPDRRVIGRGNLKADATWFGAGQADMVREMSADNGALLVVSTDQSAGEPDHSNSIVPGGFDVQS